jgi:hypothetical protein
MNRKKMAMTIVIAMMVTVGFAATATAIDVDGDCSDWTADSLVKTDPVGDYAHLDPLKTIGGYDMTAMYLHYDEGNDTLFVRLDVNGKPADLDGNGNTDSNCDIVAGPGDCTGVGCYEHYTLGFRDSPGTTIVYTCNEARAENGVDLHPDGKAQYGASCIEFSLSHASDYIDPDDYCIHATAGGMEDTPGEDTMDVCIVPSPPPIPPPQLPPSVSVLTPMGILGLIGILCIAGAGRVMRRR